MKSWQTILLVVIVVAAIIGVAFVAKNRNKNENTTQNTNTESVNQNSNSEPADANTNQQATTNNGQCVRNVNKQAMQAPIDIKNKFITFTIKDYGDVKVQLFDQDAPKTVENILRLSQGGYYDCVTFHRIIPGFVVQGGDPTGTGSGGESAFGGEFADELNPNAPSYKTGYVKGVVAMANHGPNTNGSQFFFTLDDLNQTLDKAYTIFGKVVAGQDVVDKIATVGTQSGKPTATVMIEKTTISNN